MSLYDAAWRSVCRVGMAMLTIVASRIVMIVPKSTTPSATHLYSKRPTRGRCVGSLGVTATGWVATSSRVSTSVTANPSWLHRRAGHLVQQPHQRLHLVVVQPVERLAREAVFQLGEPPTQGAPRLG